MAGSYLNKGISFKDCRKTQPFSYRGISPKVPQLTEVFPVSRNLKRCP
jgi:hypothetical protein